MNRYCTNCGSLTVRTKDNVFICENGHENFLNPVAGAVVYVLDDDNRVLFGYRSIEPQKGGLNTPGGFINPDETAEEAGLREVREELGINVTLVDYLGSYAVDYADSSKPTLCITFIAKYNGDEIIPGDDMNGGQPIWRSLDNLPTSSELAWQWQLKAQEDLITRLSIIS